MRGFFLGAALALLPLAASAATVPVRIGDYAFGPAAVTIHPGDTVVWTNTDAVPHTVTALGGAFSSGTIVPGGTWSHAFTTPGRFAYHCAIHPEMQGTVAVAPNP